MQKSVVLIYPYFKAGDPVDKLFQPLGISYLASQLKALSIPVTLVDCTFEDFDGVVARVAALEPAIIGISMMISTSRNGFDLMEALRIRLPYTVFTAGGPLPTLYPERFLPAFDIVFRGEGDLIFPQFCQDILREPAPKSGMDALDPEMYPGMTLMRSGILQGSEPVHHPASVLNALPLPDRSDIDHQQYQKFWRHAAGCRPTTLMVTRGCPFTCDFCSKPVWGNVFRLPELERVFREIEDIRHWGYDQLWIADDSFTLNLDFLRAFCREKIARSIDIQWSCLSRTIGLDAETAALMKAAGCVKVYLGLESGSDSVLALMSKRTTVMEGTQAVRLFRQAGIEVAAFFIVGYPGETRETVESTFSYALSLPLDEIFFNIPFPLPGSALFERVSGLDPQADWEKASDIRFVYVSEFDEDWLRQRIEKTLALFNRKKRQGHEISPSEMNRKSHASRGRMVQSK